MPSLFSAKDIAKEIGGDIRRARYLVEKGLKEGMVEPAMVVGRSPLFDRAGFKKLLKLNSKTKRRIVAQHS